MSDMICRKSMTRCQTPGMCSPHGGCRDTESVSSVWLAQLRSEFVAVGQKCDQLKADLSRVEPCFDDVQALVGALGWLGYSTPEGGEECAARWLELVRTLIRAAGQSKMLRMDAEKLAEFDKLKAENAGLKTGHEAYEQVVQGLRGEVEALRKDKDRLDSLESNFWDVRYGSSQNGDAGDSNVSVEIVGHWMDKPTERVIGEDYSENLRAAIDQAMKAPAYPPARPEYEFDEIPDFGGGSGNKARRRAELLGIDYDAAMGKEQQRQVT